MTCDLAVFTPTAAPAERPAFLEWFAEKTRWAEPFDPDDPSRLDPGLEAFFHHMRERFPPRTGPFAYPEASDDPNLAGYTCAGDLLHMSFAPDRAEAARAAVRSLAEEEGLGFFDAAAAEGELYRPAPIERERPGLMARLFRKRR